MRKLRNSALVGITALSLVASMTGTAFADNSSSSAAKSDDTNTSATATSGETDAPGYDVPADKRNDAHPAPVVGKCEFDLNLNEVKTGSPNCDTDALTDDLTKIAKNPKSASSVLGKRYNADQDVRGTDLLGQEKNFGALPEWAQIWYAVTVLGIIGSVIGLGYLPVMNQLKNMGVII